MQRCSLAVAAMKEGCPTALGAQMAQAQADFDAFAAPLCPQELTAPRLHAVLTHPALQPHIHGAKGVGSQGDGSAQLLCKSQEDMRAVSEILKGMGVTCCLLYTSPSPRDGLLSRMPSSA